MPLSPGLVVWVKYSNPDVSGIVCLVLRRRAMATDSRKTQVKDFTRTHTFTVSLLFCINVMHDF